MIWSSGNRNSWIVAIELCLGGIVEQYRTGEAYLIVGRYGDTVDLNERLNDDFYIELDGWSTVITVRNVNIDLRRGRIVRWLVWSYRQFHSILNLTLNPSLDCCISVCTYITRFASNIS